VLCSDLRVLLLLLQGPGPANELLAHHERASIDIRREHMRCLVETEWLNDEVINMYVAMLQVSKQLSQRQHCGWCQDLYLWHNSCQSLSALPGNQMQRRVLAVLGWCMLQVQRVLPQYRQL
jgi:hypothetical protein